MVYLVRKAWRIVRWVAPAPYLSASGWSFANDRLAWPALGLPMVPSKSIRIGTRWLPAGDHGCLGHRLPTLVQQLAGPKVLQCGRGVVG